MLKISLMSCFMCLQMFLPSLCLKTRDSGNSPEGTAAVRYTNQHLPPQRGFKHSTPRSTTWLKPLLISAQDSFRSIGFHTRILYNWNFTRYYIIHLPLAPWGFTCGYQSLHFLFWTVLLWATAVLKGSLAIRLRTLSSFRMKYDLKHYMYTYTGIWNM